MRLGDKMKTVFVSGIHGVGKNYLCDHIVDALGIPHYGASALIKEFNASLVATDKSVRDVSVNQDALVCQYKQLPDAPVIIMDGHTCLLKNGIEIERIPLSTFEQLDICSIILVSASVDIVVERMEKRDGVAHNEVLIRQMLDVEQQYSKEIAKHLHVQMLEVESTKKGIQQSIDLIKRF